jgi:hypothetical protein
VMVVLGIHPNAATALSFAKVFREYAQSNYGDFDYIADVSQLFQVNSDGYCLMSGSSHPSQQCHREIAYSINQQISPGGSIPFVATMDGAFPYPLSSTGTINAGLGSIVTGNTVPAISTGEFTCGWSATGTSNCWSVSNNGTPGTINLFGDTSAFAQTTYATFASTGIALNELPTSNTGYSFTGNHTAVSNAADLSYVSANPGSTNINGGSSGSTSGTINFFGQTSALAQTTYAQLTSTQAIFNKVLTDPLGIITTGLTSPAASSEFTFGYNGAGGVNLWSVSANTTPGNYQFFGDTSALAQTTYLVMGSASANFSVPALLPTGSTIPTAAVGTNTTGIASTAFVLANATSRHQLYWNLQSALFATVTTLSTAYLEDNAVTLKAITARLSGTISCTVAPTIAILDLGTSVTTVYGSATVLASLTTGTADGAFSSTGLSNAIAAGHYIGMGFSAGTCVTAPTMDISAEIQ